ncbi:DUF1731 domain-containing protein [Nocardia aurantia]|uniref:DUF1731 domain-containing protein n=1 Tax=Nocardia aurantia TaxID=2585199 RepID=A0A7K0DVH9_9NOCA|nr:DUF1731 domain-containing protein [Nocardia aurantia]MQY29735.1 hypothetical protein [Nocardia aurantia]
MAGTTSYTQFMALPAERLWRVLGDLTRWPEWNPVVASVDLHAPPAVGVTGDYVPAGRVSAIVHERLAKPFVITSYEPARELVIEQPEPAGTLRISWTLAARDGGTEVTQAVTLEGASAPMFRRIIGDRLVRGTALGFVRLARLAGIELRPVAQTAAGDPLNVVIAGGTGALGRRIAADLTCRGHRVTILTRRAHPELPFFQVCWDGRSVGDWAEVLRGPGRTAVINLAGKLVDCPPTVRNIDELRSSRVDSTSALVAAAARLERPIDYWIQASTTAIWSDMGEVRCTESTPLPVGLPQMTGVAQPWEAAFEGANAAHRTILRTSIVLDPESPALRRLAGLTRAGLGGRVGPGDQWFSWIHVTDWLALVRAALGLDPGIRLPDGVLVAATDFPVRNRELMAALRRHLHRPPAPPTPAPLLRVGAIFLRTDPMLGLTGRHATSEVLPHTGFRFRYPTLDEAFTDLLG